MLQPHNPTINHLGLVAGEGHLPLAIATDAMARGIPVTALCLQGQNVHALAQATGRKAWRITPGLLAQNIALARQLGLTHLVFAGKVNKWVLFRNPRLDAMAVNALKQLWPLNDDGIMVHLLDLLAQHGFTVWPQAMFLSPLMIGPGQLTGKPLTTAQWQDVDYGFTLAKHSGAMDIGQTVVVQNGMALAIEAIEGTDQCLLRAGKWGKKRAGAVVVKVAKPAQDDRFDLPTVGVRTLKRMKQAGLSILATEAYRTLYLDQAAMVQYAQSNGIVVVSVEANNLPPATVLEAVK
jgi:UDP-2,3-diacylglucosamine hydrolase